MKHDKLAASAAGKRDSGESAARQIRHYTEDQWLAEGERRFGVDMMKWRFICPSCGNIASCEDFRQYADKGATPNSATCECIGRYTGAKDAFEKSKQPCNYAGYGLFRLSPIHIDRADVETHCFAFADPTSETAALSNPSDPELPSQPNKKES